MKIKGKIELSKTQLIVKCTGRITSEFILPVQSKFYL